MKSFTKEDTKIFKGIAIMLMLAHHLLTYTDRMPMGYELISIGYVCGYSIEYIIGYFGKICVSIFMFLGGYGMYAIASKNNGNVSLGRHIIKLYEELWKIIIIFVPLGFIFFSNQPNYLAEEGLCHNFNKFNIVTLIANLTGWETTYNGEWWFFRAYICAMLAGAVFVRLIYNHKNMYIDIVIVLIWQVMISIVFPAIGALPFLNGLNTNIWYASLFELSEYSGCFLIGIVFSKYNAIIKLVELLNQFKPICRTILAMIGWIIIVFARVFFGNEVYMDMLYVPLFIACGMILLECMHVLRSALGFVGKHSTNMWLIHTFFCYYFYRISIFVYKSRNGIIAYITLFALTLVVSVLIDMFWKKIDKLVKIQC